MTMIAVHVSKQLGYHRGYLPSGCHTHIIIMPMYWQKKSGRKQNHTQRETKEIRGDNKTNKQMG